MQPKAQPRHHRQHLETGVVDNADVAPMILVHPFGPHHDQHQDRLDKQH